jgi:hypothetical protein
MRGRTARRRQPRTGKRLRHLCLRFHRISDEISREFDGIHNQFSPA